MPATESQPSVILPLVAFLAVAGSFGVGLAISLHHAAPEQSVAAPKAPPPEEVMTVYYPFPADIVITHANQKTVIAAVSFSLEGPPIALLELKKIAQEQQPELQAALLAAAQLQSEASADVAAYRADLPAALQARINALLGDETLPAPVKEVLLTKFVAR